MESKSLENIMLDFRALPDIELHQLKPILNILIRNQFPDLKFEDESLTFLMEKLRIIDNQKEIYCLSYLYLIKGGDPNGIKKLYVSTEKNWLESEKKSIN